MSRPNIEAIEARVNAAFVHLVQIMSRYVQWRISIPARPESDSDILFGGVIEDARALLVRVRELEADSERLDWLEEQIVDSIYLDDGRMIDNRGNSIRAAIDAARKQEAQS